MKIGPETKLFFKIRSAVAKIELAVLDSMLLVYTAKEADDLILRADYLFVNETWKRLRRKLMRSYRDSESERKPVRSEQARAGKAGRGKR